MFMFFGKSSKSKGKGSSNSSSGLALLGFKWASFPFTQLFLVLISSLFHSLILDGLTASTQDELFALYPRFTGKQLMFTMSFLTLCLSLPVLLVPPAWPSLAIHTIARTLNLPELLSLTGVLPHMQNTPSEPVMFQCLHFLSTHPSAIWPLALYALLGGLGQLFIFETISHFGSLTLVMVTVTRKLFTMLLSVFVFGHSLTLGQWSGIGVVFAAIGLEAGVKRSG
jgi:UDP-galactose transporter B1